MTKEEIEDEIEKITPRLYKFAQLLTRHYFLGANDLIHDLYCILLSKPEKCTHTGNFFKFCKVIIRNKFLNDIKALHENCTDVYWFSELDEKEYMYQLVDPHTPDESYEITELREMIEQLTPALKEPLKLQLKGYTYNEICDILGISFEALRKRLSRAREKLREMAAENEKKRKQ